MTACLALAGGACGESTTKKADAGDEAMDAATGGDGDASGDGDGDGDEGLMCADVKSELSCGGTACDPLPEEAESMFCAFNCCTEDGKCGALTAQEGEERSDCQERVQPDPRCESFEGLFGPVPGCCTEDNACGGITFQMCVPIRSLNQFQDTGVPEVDCDGNELPPEEEDAGI